MSAEFHSSNPFKRKDPSIITSVPPENPSTSSSPGHGAYHQTKPSSRLKDVGSIDAPKKVTKKVRVQSPPPSPSIPDSASTIGEENFTSTYKASMQDLQGEDDPFDSTLSDTSEGEVEGRASGAPANPFSKTLETMEQSGHEGLGISVVASSGRASMDVDAFKRLLMTGNAGLSTNTLPPPVPAHITHQGLGDGGSSTDASSISRQSIFETSHEPHPESPRTSHEISEPDDDSHGLISESQFSTSSRKKPPPPSSRHGRLIRVQLRDDPQLSTLNATLPATPSTTPHQFIPSPVLSTPSQTDLNKPLPPAPNRASHESDRESVFDKEAAGKLPEPPSPSSSIRKKTPPAPPITRRRSQLVSDSKLSRSNSGRLSPKVEEDERGAMYSTEAGRPRSNSGKAPPPPPSRRPASIRNSSHHLPSPSASTVSLPAPPPTRGASRKSSTGRPPSVNSLDMSSNSKRLPFIPPPPPPHRGRNSLDAQSPGDSRRTSGEQIWNSAHVQRDPGASSLSRVDAGVDKGEGKDILADLSALQREIDALRSQPPKTVT
ncbi:hypothetical protein BJ875DRAFT_445402 [Amylocarpus encephaloides]|uniref:Uncharacterized protein n=1 Tax=Amylocarpus encephaloides TaxID=45428 RepID=A0A9P7YAC2_9HELO|nr:hypothetical protein BJ875DRAFT_445402 [Amylocarpus encephaloides]